MEQDLLHGAFTSWLMFLLCQDMNLFYKKLTQYFSINLEKGDYNELKKVTGPQGTFFIY